MKSALAGSVLCAVLTIFLTFHGFDVHHADGVRPPPRRYPRRVINETESKNKSFWHVNQAYYEAKWKWENEPRTTKAPENGSAGPPPATGENGTGAAPAPTPPPGDGGAGGAGDGGGASPPPAR